MLALGIVAALALAHPAATLAQDSGEDTLQIKDLPGVQTAVSRTYTLDFEALFTMEGTPTPEATGPQLFALGGSIIQFGNDDDARGAYTTVLDEVQKQSDAGVGTPDAVSFETIDLGADLGDERTGLRMAGDDTGGIASGDIVALVVRDGSLIYLVTGVADTGDPSDAVVAFTRSVMDAKAGGDEVTFNEDGTSSGGLWDKFPKADDPVIAGLPSAMDTDLMADESDS